MCVLSMRMVSIAICYRFENSGYQIDVASDIFRNKKPKALALHLNAHLLQRVHYKVSAAPRQPLAGVARAHRDNRRARHHARVDACRGVLEDDAVRRLGAQPPRGARVRRAPAALRRRSCAPCAARPREDACPPSGLTAAAAIARGHHGTTCVPMGPYGAHTYARDGRRRGTRGARGERAQGPRAYYVVMKHAQEFYQRLNSSRLQSNSSGPRNVSAPH